MTTTWEEAKTASTTAEVRENLFDALEAQRSKVNGFPDTAPQRAMVEGNAAAIAYETTVRADLAKTASTETVKDAGASWVDAAMSWFDLDNGTGGKGRILASPARWDVPMQITAAAAPYTVNNASKIQLQAQDGTIFEASQGTAVTLNAASSYKGTVRFAARLAGTSGNVTPGQIVKMISGPAGMSVDTGETQVLVTAARDKENDDQFIARGLGRWATLGAGWTDPAFDFWIPQFALSVTRWRVRKDNPLGPGTALVIIANAAGPATTDEVDAVQAGLSGRSFQPVGSEETTVVAATEHALVLTATLQTDGSNADVEANALAALAALERLFPLGPATLTMDLVRSVLMGSAIFIATIPTGGTSEQATLDLPGFSSVEKITVLSLVADEAIADAEVLTISATITVT